MDPMETTASTPSTTTFSAPHDGVDTDASGGALAAIGKVLVEVAQRDRQSAEHSAHEVDIQRQFLEDFAAVCEREVRPAMEAVLRQLQHSGGGGMIEHHGAGETRVRYPRLMLWMSLEGGMDGVPRYDRNPYLQFDADHTQTRSPSLRRRQMAWLRRQPKRACRRVAALRAHQRPGYPGTASHRAPLRDMTTRRHWMGHNALGAQSRPERSRPPTLRRATDHRELPVGAVHDARRPRRTCTSKRRRRSVPPPPTSMGTASMTSLARSGGTGAVAYDHDGAG